MIELTELIMEDLRKRDWTLATAESCTAGRIGQVMAAAKGSAEVYLGGVIAYQKACKQRVLAVPAELLARPEGAVSADVAIAMAEGARRLTGASVALASTGVAGPSEDEDGNPVGRVVLAIAAEGLDTSAKRFDFGVMDSDAIVARTVDGALVMIAGLLGRHPS